jgi:hypothetical protein
VRILGLDFFSGKTVYTDGSAPSKDMWRFCRSKTCCFTGHRPEQLPGGGNAQSESFAGIKETAQKYVGWLLDRGYDTFVTGMSRGFDLIMAQYLLDECPAEDSINIVCAVPYPKQFREMRTDSEMRLYQRVLERADLIAVSSREYHHGCYAVRNRLMVNCSSAIIGYLASPQTRSGTMQTINMASKAGLNMYIMYGNQNTQL